MISQTAEYALRAVVVLAAEPGCPRTARDLAEAARVPSGYMAKVLQALARAGIIGSQRGLHGGFTLQRPPETVTIYEVVQAVDPIRRITSCPLHLPEHTHELCPLHQRLDEAIALVERTFQTSTVADMLKAPPHIGALGANSG